jgi:hypothetical protein
MKMTFVQRSRGDPLADQVTMVDGSNVRPSPDPAHP